MVFSLNQGTVFASLWIFAIAPVIARAQVIPDGTIPTVVEQIDNMDKITGGERVGNNLFHSFETFSVSEGMEAIFENSMDIENIYTRVTGSEISSIDGLLKTNGGANFFLINPNGVVFGENARLDVGGSFLATTADNIVFADGKTFGVELENQNPILTVTAPIGLGFLGNNGSITVNGRGNQITNDSSFSPIEFGERPKGIYVRDGQTLALIGNGINFNGGVVTSEGGKVYLTSVENGSVNISQTENGLSAIDTNVNKYQDINLNRQSLIDGSGERVGKVSVIGKNINFSDGSFLLSQDRGFSSLGSINIKATENLTLLGTSPDGEISSSIRSEVLKNGEGTETNLNISANQIILGDGAKIRANSFGNKASGNINLNISDLIQLSNAVISSSTFAEGNGGNIFINTDFLIANSEENSDITTNAEFGNGGNISIEALNIIGIEFREQLTQFSDITAASEFGLDGTVAISNPDNNLLPIELNLTPDIIDANTIFTNSYCKINQNSKFIITGRGGLPLEDYKEMLPQYIWEDWRTIEAIPSNKNTAVISNNNSLVTSSQNTSNTIQMVRGWKVNRQGEIMLTADPIMVTPHVSYNKIPGCN